MVRGDGFTATVIVGTLAGATSPASVYSPIVGADISCAGPISLPLDPGFEHAVLVLDGSLALDGQDVPPGRWATLAPGAAAWTWTQPRAPASCCWAASRSKRNC